MKYIILCGGIGKRCNQYSLQKPLNYINSKHLIELIIESIPTNEIYIIYNIILDQYNFKEIIINKFKKKKIFFSSVDFTTRGAIETAYIGLKNFNFINDNENIIFIDNDNIHTYPLLELNYNYNFIGYGIDYVNNNFSFITIKDNNVINIEEKNKISDYYCCGLYGFKNISTFLKLANQIITSNFKTKNEFYFSQIYKLLIQNNEPIIPFFVKETKHLGTYNEIISNHKILPQKK
jgi:NDP-sugar pyrophosphorylase family protein